MGNSGVAYLVTLVVTVVAYETFQISYDCFFKKR